MSEQKSQRKGNRDGRNKAERQAPEAHEDVPPEFRRAQRLGEEPDRSHGIGQKVGPERKRARVPASAQKEKAEDVTQHDHSSSPEAAASLA